MKKTETADIRVALCGNPNVGKSTVFNALTGMHQHTGNWTGKTVCTAKGCRKENGVLYELIDLPGTYSLKARSTEEEVARDAICFGDFDGTAVVCDATKLSRNLGLVLQILEIMPHTVVVLNLMDEAKRMKLEVDTEELSNLLGVPVIPTSATKGKGIADILPSFYIPTKENIYAVRYDDRIEEAISMVRPSLKDFPCKDYQERFLAIRLLENDESFLQSLEKKYKKDFMSDAVKAAVKAAWGFLTGKNIVMETFMELIGEGIMKSAEVITDAVTKRKGKAVSFTKADRFLTGKLSGIPVMLFLLFLVFWITIIGANYPSSLLEKLFAALEKPLYQGVNALKTPPFLADLLVLGIYRTLGSVVAVMLPPMFIFFPLFTALEDVGYLPRVAFNLDGAFCKCGACGKQGLTMCMGLGCNVVGVTGARIIDSKRERLIAILTNAFIPCNGRFPAMITIATVFLAGSGMGGSVLTAGVLALAIVLCVAVTFLVSFLLSKTLLKGTGASFILEMPPFRKPQFGKILVRSIFDRSLFVLGRAVKVTLPAGAILFLLTHITLSGVPVTAYIGQFLDPLGKLMGLDGVILLAFLLALPANEIILPLCMMLYRAEGAISELGTAETLHETLVSYGWTVSTAICFLLFLLMHWPCGTTLLTVKKETGSRFYTFLSFILPTVCGILFCMTANLILKLL